MIGFETKPTLKLEKIPSYILKLQCLSVRLCGQCLEDSSSHCPFPVECFGGWGKGEPGEARGLGAGGPARAGRRGWAGKERAGGGHGRGELDGCIMYRVHTSFLECEEMGPESDGT